MPERPPPGNRERSPAPPGLAVPTLAVPAVSAAPVAHFRAGGLELPGVEAAITVCMETREHPAHPPAAIAPAGLERVARHHPVTIRIEPREPTGGSLGGICPDPVDEFRLAERAVAVRIEFGEARAGCRREVLGGQKTVIVAVERLEIRPAHATVARGPVGACHTGNAAGHNEGQKPLSYLVSRLSPSRRPPTLRGRSDDGTGGLPDSVASAACSRKLFCDIATQGHSAP